MTPDTFNDDVSQLNQVLQTAKEKISHIKDLDSLLDHVLFEARTFTRSDAGSIFLAEDDRLKFSYVQNDSLFRDDINTNKFLYSNQSLPINDSSIAGYVALAGRSLTIDDAYRIDPGLPFTFNASFDQNAGYRTRSILTVPLKSGQGKVIGVMQLINTVTPEGKSATYTPRQVLMAEMFANEAAVAIERAQMTRTIILRMIKMAELRDPKETGAHVNRVGSYSIEIYHRWARTKGIDEKDIKHYKDNLRLAAMLHDVGKVAISDTILKKPGRLTEDEFHVIKYHTLAGAHLFRDPTSELDALSAEIALNHHEKWNGAGYPGRTNLDAAYENLQYGPGRHNDEIPLSGRIVALCDVFDALIETRCYKGAWPEEKVLGIIEEESGKHFDPDIVEAFFGIYDVIKAIRERFREPGA